MTKRKPKTERFNFDDFCHRFRVKLYVVAEYLNVNRQQINNWKIANAKRKGEDGKDQFVMELNVETGKVNVIKTEKIVHSFDVEVLES